MITPDQYPDTPVYELLNAAARGLIGIDQRLVHAIVDRGDAAIPDLVRFAEADLDEDDPVNLEEDLIAIFRYLKAPEALPFYVECVRRQPDEIPDDLVEAFHEIGAPALEPLLALHDELGEEQGAEIVFLLATLRVRDDRVFRLLLDHLEYDLADGAFCLGLYGDPTARPALEKALAELDADDPEMSGLRQDISDALERLDEPAPPAHHEAFDLWDLYPETAEPQLDVLSAADRLNLLESDSDEQRASAANSFFNQELSPEAREALVRHAQEDPSPKVRARCWEALADDDDSALRARMMERLTDAGVPAEERAGALLGLYSEMDDAAIFEHAKQLYNEPTVRAKVLETMWRSLDRRFSPFFPPHLDDADEEVRRDAIRGVGYLGIASEVGKLEKLFEDEEYRPDALFSYALAMPAQISRGRIRSVFRRIDERAGGLSPAEAELVQFALDERLALHGLAPVFFPEEGDEEVPDEPELAAVAAGPKVGRNDPCPCGSGKKYKKCCGQS